MKLPENAEITYGVNNSYTIISFNMKDVFGEFTPVNLKSRAVKKDSIRQNCVDIAKTIGMLFEREARIDRVEEVSIHESHALCSLHGVWRDFEKGIDVKCGETLFLINYYTGDVKIVPNAEYYVDRDNGTGKVFRQYGVITFMARDYGLFRKLTADKDFKLYTFSVASDEKLSWVPYTRFSNNQYLCLRSVHYNAYIFVALGDPTHKIQFGGKILQDKLNISGYVTCFSLFEDERYVLLFDHKRKDFIYGFNFGYVDMWHVDELNDVFMLIREKKRGQAIKTSIAYLSDLTPGVLDTRDLFAQNVSAVRFVLKYFIVITEDNKCNLLNVDMKKYLLPEWCNKWSMSSTPDKIKTFSTLGSCVFATDKDVYGVFVDAGVENIDVVKDADLAAHNFDVIDDKLLLNAIFAVKNNQPMLFTGVPRKFKPIKDIIRIGQQNWGIVDMDNKFKV